MLLLTAFQTIFTTLLCLFVNICQFTEAVHLFKIWASVAVPPLSHLPHGVCSVPCHPLIFVGVGKQPALPPTANLNNTSDFFVYMLEQFVKQNAIRIEVPRKSPVWSGISKIRKICLKRS